MSNKDQIRETLKLLSKLESAIEGERRNQVGAHVLKTNAIFKKLKDAIPLIDTPEEPVKSLSEK